MKKLTSILIAALILMTSMCFVASATEENNVNTYTYEKDNVEYTVEFTDSNLTAEEQEEVAQKLINGESNSATYGLTCTLFGHDLSTETVAVITHKVMSYEPRCRRQAFKVTTCSRCDYQEQTLTSTGYINCCPVD